MIMPKQLTTYQALIHHFLEAHLLCLESHMPPTLYEALRYSVLNGGKCVRAALVLGTGELWQVPNETLIAPASAIECIHTYSLIHDDLPSMDNATLRRGKLTTHLAFDEATAILVGDALQSMAIELICLAPDLQEQQKMRMILSLTHASGPLGMVAGQILDMTSQKKILSGTELENLHLLKTGKLIETSMMFGAIAGNTNAEMESLIKQLAKHIGLAFQIQDDILDAKNDAVSSGKESTDQRNEKNTYVSLYGIATAEQKLKVEIEAAHQILNRISPHEHWLHELIDFLSVRNQ